ncbi:LLM class oxidoreductase [Kangiella sp. TOML190]|uniref:LLM class oxidoreductase n=1 Tax=Kangiella sp. TOML190 TaxID=2931351 RepID=UPI00204112F2|nr:LLM class oxidoreductase [Kangiella sp. TOML190]
MTNMVITSKFPPLNNGYNSVFKGNQLSVGLVVPLEQYQSSPIPSMKRHLERVKLAEELGFASVWLRDVPFNVPSFGDAGQPYDPFVYLGYLAGQTSKIALGVASIVLPLRHPAHVAKSAASVDELSQGRLILGIASGDRPDEYPATNLDYHDRGKRFRDSFEYIRKMQDINPRFTNQYGSLNGSIDMVPKPVGKEIPMLITGGSQQSVEWIAQNGNGWMLYPRPADLQKKIISEWRELIEETHSYQKPIMEPLYVDLSKNPDEKPTPIHLGLRLGAKHLANYLRLRRDIGVNHVAINLRFNKQDTEETMQQIASEVLPEIT